MNKEQVFAVRNLRDASMKYKYITEHVEDYEYCSYWSDSEIDGRWYAQRHSCVMRIKNALHVLYPRQLHKTMLDKYCPGWAVV